MSQKFIKVKNNNGDSHAYGKYYATAVYDKKFIETEELASFIQTQASVKKSDIKAVLDELGEALKHFFEMGQKVKLDGIGIFKVGFSSIGVDKAEDCSVATITTRRILFQPETERVVVGQERDKTTGAVKQKYVVVKTLVKDVVFEETHDNTMNAEDGTTHGSTGGDSGSTTNGGNSQQGGGSTGGNTGGGSTTGDNTGGSGNTGGNGDDYHDPDGGTNSDE